MLRAPGAPDAMHVILRMLRHVIVDDVADVEDIQAARGDIRGHQQFKTPVPKPFKACSRSRWVRFEWSSATEWLAAFS